MKCQALYPQKCEKDAVCIYAGQPMCGGHARQAYNWQIQDATQEYQQRLADLNKDFRAAMEAGIQPQDLEETPDDQEDL